MATVINPKNERIHTLTSEEGRAYFESVVKELLKVDSDEFLQRRDAFKSSPHYDTVMFLLPLIGEDAED